MATLASATIEEDEVVEDDTVELEEVILELLVDALELTIDAVDVLDALVLLDSLTLDWLLIEEADFDDSDSLTTCDVAEDDEEPYISPLPLPQSNKPHEDNKIVDPTNNTPNFFTIIFNPPNLFSLFCIYYCIRFHQLNKGI